MAENRTAWKTRHQGVLYVIGGNSYGAVRPTGGGFCVTCPHIINFPITAMGLLQLLGLASDSEQRGQWLIQNGKEFVAEMQKNKSLPVVSTSLFLNSGEKAILNDQVRYFVLRSIRRSIGAGLGTRMGRFGVGGFGSQSESHKEWRFADEGTLTLTSQRLVFDGGKENMAIDIKKILSLECSPNEIHVSIQGSRHDVAFVVANPLIWQIAIGILRVANDPFALQEEEMVVNFGEDNPSSTED